MIFASQKLHIVKKIGTKTFQEKCRPISASILICTSGYECEHHIQAGSTRIMCIRISKYFLHHLCNIFSSAILWIMKIHFPYQLQAVCGQQAGCNQPGCVTQVRSRAALCQEHFLVIRFGLRLMSIPRKNSSQAKEDTNKHNYSYVVFFSAKESLIF